MYLIGIYYLIKCKFFHPSGKRLLWLGDLPNRLTNKCMKLLLNPGLQRFLLLTAHTIVCNLVVYNCRDFFTPLVNRKQSEGDVVECAVIFFYLLLLARKRVKAIAKICLSAKQDT